MQFNGPDRKESWKVVVTKICFYGKTKQKMKVVATKVHLMVKTKRKLEKEVATKI